MPWDRMSLMAPAEMEITIGLRKRWIYAALILHWLQLPWCREVALRRAIILPKKLRCREA